MILESILESQFDEFIGMRIQQKFGSRNGEIDCVDGRQRKLSEALWWSKQTIHMFSSCQEQIRTLSSFLSPFSPQVCTVSVSQLASHLALPVTVELRAALASSPGSRQPEGTVGIPGHAQWLPLAVVLPSQEIRPLCHCSCSTCTLRQHHPGGVSAAPMRGLTQSLATAQPLKEIWLVASQVT